MPQEASASQLGLAGLPTARLGFVNRKSDVVWGERAARGWEPVSADACPRVSDLPGLMAEEVELSAAGRKSALRVFVQYWNNTTDEGREAMLDADLQADAMEADDMASAAAVVHGIVRERRCRCAALGAWQEGDFSSDALRFACR